MPNVTKLSRRPTSSSPVLPVPSIPTVWDLTDAVAPLETIINGMVFYEFSDLDSQQMHTEITIPSNYIASSAISLESGMFYTAPVAGNVLFKAQVSLIRPSSTVEGTYPNNYLSTNVQIPVSIVSNQFTEIPSIDLSSVLGVIGIAVLPNDRLKVTFYRDIANESPSCAGSVFLLQKSFVVKFS